MCMNCARALDRQCKEYNAYRWLLEAVIVTHHTLADFWIARWQYLGAQLTQRLMAESLMILKRTAQEEMCVY